MKIKHVIRFIWFATIFLGIVLYILYPNKFTPESIKTFLTDYKGNLLVIYAVVSIVKGFFLLPNTPFVIAGILMFPDLPLSVFFISLFGIVLGGAGIYWLSYKFDLFGAQFKSDNSKIKTIKLKLDKYGFWVILLWSFLPFTPTNLICYVAGSFKSPFKSFVFGLFIGQSALLAIYVFGISELIVNWLN